MAVAQDRLTPKARALVDLFERSAPLSTMTPTEARSAPAPLDPAPQAVGSVIARAIPGPDGPLPVRIYRPRVATRAALVYFHGGGWVIGSLDGADATCRALTNEGRVNVISIGYRLAPETKFPGAVDDAYAAVRWVADHAAEIGVDPRRIAVGGSSAGGNLAAIATLVARERGGPKIAFQLLLVPAMEFRSTAASMDDFAEGYGLSRADMEWFGAHYLRTDADRDDPHASILRADLHGLPPALVITAECDPLRDDGETYAKRLGEAGVAAEVKRYPGMFHGFMGFAAQLPEAAQAQVDAGAALRAALR